MAESHVCGQYTMLEWGGLGVYSPRTFLKFESRKCHFLHSEHPNLLVFEINKGKNAQKVNHHLSKKINHHLSLLIRGG
jgi:hypothetical protein